MAKASGREKGAASSAGGRGRAQRVFDALRDEVRLASALELLELTDLPMGEVAATLSYASAEVFAEAFRRMRGCSPREWWAQHARTV